MRCDGGHRNDSPCLDCPERIAGCHDRCKRFKAWRQGVDKVNAPNSKADMRFRKNVYQRGREVAERDPRQTVTNRKERRRLAREKAAGARS